MADGPAEPDRSVRADSADNDLSNSAGVATAEGEQAPTGTTAAKQAGPHPRAGTPRGGPERRRHRRIDGDLNRVDSRTFRGMTTQGGCG